MFIGSREIEPPTSTSERIEPPRSISGRTEPPASVLRGVEPPIADEFDSSRRVSPPLARAPCCTRASLGAKRCMRRVLYAPGACISELERCVRRGCCMRVGSLYVCQAPSVEHFEAFECCNG